MIAEYAVTHDEDQILELVFTDEEGTTFLRDNRGWTELNPDQDNSTVFDQPLILVTEDFIPIYDKNDEVPLEIATQYRVI